MLLVGGVYFLLLLILVIYLPGRFFIRVSKFHIPNSLIRFPVEIGIGSAFFMAGIYFLSWLHIEILYLILLLPVNFLEVINIRNNYKKVNITLPLFESLIICVGSLFALYIMGRSGYEINGQLYFYGVNATDAVFHISLIGNLIHHFPPTHAGMSGIPLHGYNFLYDLLVASFAKFFFLNPFDLFFRYFSLFVAIFYGLSTLALARFLKMDGITSRFFVFLAYFAQGTIFIFTYLGITYDPGIVHPLANIVDPSVLFSISLFFLCFILLFSMSKKSHIVVTAVLFAVVPMIKIYTAFLLFAALGCVTILSFILNKKNKFQLASVLLLGGLLGGLLYAPINLGIGKLVFAPFLLYSHFLESFAPINNSDWWMRLLVYFEHNNYIRIIQNYVLLLLLFFIPSLSLRLFSVLSLKNVFKKSFYSLQNIFLMSAIIVGIVIPTFFIQNIAVFVIIQFLWITYFLLLIPSAYGLSSVYAYLPRLGKYIFVIIIVAVSIPDLLSLIIGYSYNPTIIPSSTVALAKEVKKTVPHSRKLIVLNTHKSGERLQTEYAIPLISAISEHDVYYEPEVLEFTGLDLEVIKRRELIAKIDRILLSCSDRESVNHTLTSILKDVNISYIMTLEEKPCLDTLTSLTLVSRKGEAALYNLR